MRLKICGVADDEACIVAAGYSRDYKIHSRLTPLAELSWPCQSLFQRFANKARVGNPREEARAFTASSKRGEKPHVVPRVLGLEFKSRGLELREIEV
jgi:hypothetical protein